MDRPRAVAFDVDRDSMTSLRQAFPEWVIEANREDSTADLAKDWNPASASLLVVGMREEPGGTLSLCRGLRSQRGRARTPILVLVRPERDDLVRAALDAGADSCLVVPVHPKDLIEVVARAARSNQPGRHTLGLDRAQRPDHWRDDGGEA